MNLIQKKHTNVFRNYYSSIILLIVVVFINSGATQQKSEWVDIFLNDTDEYVQYGVKTIDNSKYPPSKLFDGKFNTCWVSKTNNSNTALYLKLPNNKSNVLNIFSGYGKTKELYYQNARPQKIRLNIYAAINPDGYASEYGLLYKAVKFSQEQIIHLADSFAVQSIPLDYSQKELTAFINMISKTFDADFQMPKAETCLILKLEILDIYCGSKYTDVCISEIFFNDCFISSHPQTANPIKKVYLNDDENTLLLDDSVHKREVVYCDTLSVLQIIDVSENKKWAIIISMPAEIEGRVETTYLLFDLLNKLMVNFQLEKCTGNYLPGNEMYFKSGENGRTYLTYLAKIGEIHKIELR